jgi:hypothetical protein
MITFDSSGVTVAFSRRPRGDATVPMSLLRVPGRDLFDRFVRKREQRRRRVGAQSAYDLQLMINLNLTARMKPFPHSATTYQLQSVPLTQDRSAGFRER